MNVDDTPRIGYPRYSTGIGLAVIHLIACAAFLPRFFSWSAVAAAFVLFYITGGIGICLGFHRLFTHRSFSVPRPMEYLIAFCGALALQGGMIEWIGTHRAHHAFSDTPRDPHDMNKGFLWSHCTWLFLPNPARLTDLELQHFSREIISDPYFQFLDRYELALQIGLGVLLYLAGGWSWVIWGIFVRLVVVYNITWLVNSSAHSTGYRSFDAGDLSTNNWWVALLAWGEGWHNNHHTFPSSARHGLKSHEFDFTWLTIRFLSAMKLAGKVKTPSAETLQRRRDIDLRAKTAEG